MPLTDPVQVDVWTADLDVFERACRAQLEACLAPEEAARAAGFLRERDRGRFVVGRGLLRQVLARYLGCGPDEVPLLEVEGRPAVAGACHLENSLSHCEARLVLAVSSSARVGVDVERVRGLRDLEELAALVCTPAEQRFIAGPPEQREARFVSLWTAKEAYLKALGTGLSSWPDRVEISALIDPASQVPFRFDGQEALGWQLRWLPCFEGAVTALAVETEQRLEVVIGDIRELLSG